jgi:alkylated DNA repair protein (DNA oxidative demethylase)
MKRQNSEFCRELFEEYAELQPIEHLGEGATLLRGFASGISPELIDALKCIVAVSPFRHMVTPGGYKMSVAMTNCGAAGWVSDRSGYRYETRDPQTARPWPAMPRIFLDLAQRAASASGFQHFQPDACLINRYEPGARLTLHQDKNEADFHAPIVSVSLGVPAVFFWGGKRRADTPRRISLQNGDAVVWGGPSRLVFHGVAPLASGHHPLTGPRRINLTFRKAL